MTGSAKLTPRRQNNKNGPLSSKIQVETYHFTEGVDRTAIRPQRTLFSREDLETSSDRGRDDCPPVRGMWNSILIQMVFQHPRIENLRRELSRTGQLREIVRTGSFSPLGLGVYAVLASDPRAFR